MKNPRTLVKRMKILRGRRGGKTEPKRGLVPLYNISSTAGVNSQDSLKKGEMRGRIGRIQE